MPEEIKRTYWYLFGRKFVYGISIRSCLVPGPAPDKLFRRDELMQVHETDADLIGSLTENGKHAPALDIDYPATLEVDVNGVTWISIRGPETRIGAWRALIEGLALCGLLGNATAEDERVLIVGLLGEQRFPLPKIPIRATVRLVPSSTKKHFHLYIEKELSWDSYRRLLNDLRQTNVIDPDFHRMSVGSEQSFLLKPGLRKQDFLTS